MRSIPVVLAGWIACDIKLAVFKLSAGPGRQIDTGTAWWLGNWLGSHGQIQNLLGVAQCQSSLKQQLQSHRCRTFDQQMGITPGASCGMDREVFHCQY